MHVVPEETILQDFLEILKRTLAIINKQNTLVTELGSKTNKKPISIATNGLWKHTVIGKTYWEYSLQISNEEINVPTTTNHKSPKSPHECCHFVYRQFT